VICSLMHGEEGIGVEMKDSPLPRPRESDPGAGRRARGRLDFTRGTPVLVRRFLTAR
jgi:hypothetical protein